MNRYYSMIEKLYPHDSANPVVAAENALSIAQHDVHYRDADYSVLEQAEFNLEIAESIEDYELEQDRIDIENDLIDSLSVFSID